MNILVTGGLGFIGSHLVDVLVSNGHNVTVIDNLSSESSSKDYMLEGVTYWIGDIRDLDAKSCKDNFDSIFHLAALARIQPSFKMPVEYFDIDAMGTCRVLELARSQGANVIYAGSSSAFGGPMLNPYAFSKYTGEQLCELYSKVYNVPTSVARFFNVYGDRHPVSGDYATIVGIFEEQTKMGKNLTVTGDGEQRRDFTHVSDIISGLIMLNKKDVYGDVFQLGTERNYSINELASMFGGEIKYIPSRPGEARNTLADISKMKSTGWSPSTFIEDYIEHWKIKNNI
jgi:UDP-glucose 4-epimerase